MNTRLPAPERRRQLLDVAIEQFAAYGYFGVSMSVLATSAGVSKPVLYQHFGSKRDLYLEVLNEVGDRMLGAILTATDQADSPRARVEEGFRAYFRFVRDAEPAFRVLFGGGRRDAEFAASVTRVEARIADAIAGLIEADLDEAHRRVLAHGIVGLGEVAARLALSAGDELEPDVLAAQVADLAWSGLRGVRRLP